MPRMLAVLVVGDLIIFAAIVSVLWQLTAICERLNLMAITEATFDADLTSLTTAIGAYITATDAYIAALKAAAPQVDLSAEDAQVQAASASLATALAAIPAETTTAPGSSAPATAAVTAALKV